MDLTNKAMASIFNISVRGVETARYRLKKKIQISKAVWYGQTQEIISGQSKLWNGADC